MRTKQAVPARERILAFMAEVNRPVTGGELLNYVPSVRTYLRARDLRSLMAELEAEGLVSAESRFSPTALGRVAWTYRLNP